MQARFRIGDLLREMGRVADGHRAFLVLAGLGLVALYTVMDMISESASMTGGMIAGLVVDYAVLQRLLDRQGEKWRLGSVFAASFISGLAMLVGFVLLILPGIYLMARWSLTSAFIIAEGDRSRESLTSSWQATAQCWLPIAVTYVILLVIFVAGLVAVEFGQVQLAVLPVWVQTALPNVFASFYGIAGSILVAGAFRLSRNPANDLDTVFA